MWIFAGNFFHRFALNLYFLNAFGAKERSKVYCYQILLNFLRLLIVGIVVAECVGNTLSTVSVFPFPSLQYIPPKMYHRWRHIRLKLSHLKRCFILNVIWTFFSIFCFSSSFLRLEGWRLLCIKLISWKPQTLLFFKQLIDDLIVL